jgi:hypothetical protein
LLVISHRILERYVSSGPEGRIWHLCETARWPDSGERRSAFRQKP